VLEISFSPITKSLMTNLVSGSEHKESRLVNLDPRLGNFLDNGACFVPRQSMSITANDK
jgi:hypothetical protein